MARIGFLAHHQPLDSRPSTHVSKDVAELLVSRLAAERISKKLIRAFPPGSVFLRLVPAVLSSVGRPYIPEKLPWAELPGLIFEPPPSAQRNFVSCQVPA